ncbi:MAG: hypothetical protein NVSMB19_03370 [Vulcanimicrobiaceae bacterium]
MSQARSSKASGARAARGALVAGIAAFALAACSRGVATSVESPKPVTDTRGGYVRMDALVKKHPLYTQLARLDEDLQALQLKSVGSEIARSGADIAVEEKRLQGELDRAATRTKAALADKQHEYAKREQAAINAAVGGGAAGAAGPGGAEIAGGIARQAQAQQQSVLRDAQKNLATYRDAVIAQDRSAVESLNTSLAERASRSYRARADDLQKKEADYALALASEDSAERLSLRTKLSNLALDDASRDDVKRQLDALDKKEADALGAMKNRDQATLVGFQRELHDRVRADLAVQVAQLRKRTLAKINARERSTRQEIVKQLAPFSPNAGPGRPASSGAAGMAPDMRAKLEALHKKYQDDFNKDASQTIAAFQRTRSDLTRRFRELSSVDRSAQAGANKQMGALQKQRGDLYGQMVAQIGREVKVIAEKRGINVVVSDVVAPAGGVDLTADAEKDIESLHE